MPKSCQYTNVNHGKSFHLHSYCSSVTVQTCTLAEPTNPAANYTVTYGPEQIDSSTYTYGNIVTLTCASGYTVSGASSIACVGSNEWLGEQGALGDCESKYR